MVCQKLCSRRQRRSSMSNIVFLAPSVDSVTPTTIHGAGHAASITDEAYVASLINDGKASLQGARIRGIYVAPIAATTATVNWTVDQSCTAMKVDYGTTSGYGSSVAATPAAGQGAVTAALATLTTGTLYHYRITVTYGAFTTSTPDLTFRTA
jgi:hypothetical protein